MRRVLLFVLLLTCTAFSQYYRVNIAASNQRVLLWETQTIEFMLRPVEMTTYYEYRYKLNAPGDFWKGIRYNVNKWSEWTRGYVGQVVYENFMVEGDYSLIVEFRDGETKEDLAKSGVKFEAYYMMPEVKEDLREIDWEKIYAGRTEEEKFARAAEEYRKAYEYWNKEYTYQYNKLKGTTSAEELFDIVLETVTATGAETLSGAIIQSAGETAADEFMKKILSPITVYDIAKTGTLSALLLVSNSKVNKAAILTAGTYHLWKHFEKKSARTTKKTKAPPGSDNKRKKPLGTWEQKLIASYPFNGNANDEAGKGKKGLVYGAELIADRFNNSNSAYYFDGSEDWIDIPDDLIPSDGADFSICYWFKTTMTNFDIVFNADGKTAGRFGTGLNPEGNFHFWLNSTYGYRKYERAVSVRTVNDNTWHFAAIVRDNSTVKIYIDNKLEATADAPSNINTSLDLGIGENSTHISRYPGKGYRGYADDIKFFDAALSNSEIGALYELTTR